MAYDNTTINRSSLWDNQQLGNNNSTNLNQNNFQMSTANDMEQMEFDPVYGRPARPRGSIPENQSSNNRRSPYMWERGREGFGMQPIVDGNAMINADPYKDKIYSGWTAQSPYFGTTPYGQTKASLNAVYDRNYINQDPNTRYGKDQGYQSLWENFVASEGLQKAYQNGAGSDINDPLYKQAWNEYINPTSGYVMRTGKVGV